MITTIGLFGVLALVLATATHAAWKAWHKASDSELLAVHTSTPDPVTHWGVRSGPRHLTGSWAPACGTRHWGIVTENPGLVTCLACVRSDLADATRERKPITEEELAELEACWNAEFGGKR